ncbi:FAD-dependent oxidoreductase [Propionicimonas sp.]|uniref:FAD-dependent oxidoreductase n=1 Tax=Propionicimonas sp. TaxID=1955623 RepID=UPI0039E31FD7
MSIPATHAGHEHRSRPPTMERSCDVAVIGGSAAGLAAALQLARQRRSVLVVDDGSPRNAPAAHMHGYPGYDGAPPTALPAAGREEVRRYGGEVLTGRVSAVRRGEGGRFRLDLTGGHSLSARRVLAATGLTDDLPPIEGLLDQWGRAVVHCPFCHGFELRDRSVVQIVSQPLGLHSTPLWRHLTGRLTVVLHDPTGIDDVALAGLRAAGVPVENTEVSRIVSGADGHLRGVELVDGRLLPADAVAVGPRFRARAETLAGVGLRTTAHPSGAGDFLEVDQVGATAVPGIYAAGNLTDPSLQVLPSAAQGSQVGAMIAFSLAAEDLDDTVRRSGERADWEHRYSGPDRAWSTNPNGSLVIEAGDLPPGRALDVGTGEGADALWLAERGWSVTATDISGNALARVRTAASERGLDITLLRVDANDPDPYGGEVFDLVSLQYGSFTRTPDQRGLRSLLAAVAPGGTLLVVHHDLSPSREPVDVATQTRMFDPQAYVGVDEIAAALAARPGTWQIECHQTRPRPVGAVSTHHIDDVVLRARRRG